MHHFIWVTSLNEQNRRHVEESHITDRTDPTAGVEHIFFSKLLSFCPKMILVFVRGNAYKVQLYRLWNAYCYPPIILAVIDISHLTDTHTSRHTPLWLVCAITLLLSWLSLCQAFSCKCHPSLLGCHEPKELSWQQVWPAEKLYFVFRHISAECAWTVVQCTTAEASKYFISALQDHWVTRSVST